MEISLITAVFGAIGTFVGFLITIITFSKNRDKDVRSDAREQERINAKLDNINVKVDSVNGGVESLRIDFKVEQKERAILAERVTRVEESASSAHKRINEIVEKEAVR